MKLKKDVKSNLYILITNLDEYCCALPKRGEKKERKGKKMNRNNQNHRKKHMILIQRLI